ncbi:MAG: hypothetical protein D6715_08465 [Calditrichaeota bacterium]|nr:MAG: hypothetical protein D6715_08465 [Calditrichota bacterium]
MVQHPHVFFYYKVSPSSAQRFLDGRKAHAPGARTKGNCRHYPPPALPVSERNKKRHRPDRFFRNFLYLRRRKPMQLYRR